MGTSALARALAYLSLSGRLRGLEIEQSRLAVTEIIDGEAEPALVAAFLTALAFRGETANDLAGAVAAVRSRMTPLEIDPSCRPILDTCGTGGDGANSVNISTAAALVVAACGVRVAKHGNRSASGNSGSAEVLTELGVKIDPDAIVIHRCLSDIGITFLLAPRFHPAMKHAAPIRRLLPFRTLLNLVGPLANPASPEFQLIGVPDAATATLMAQAIREIQAEEVSTKAALVVAGAGGLDEVSLAGENRVHMVGVASPRIATWEPADFGLPASSKQDLQVTGPADSAARVRAMLDGELGPVRDVVLANASAALLLVGRANSLVEGVAIAAKAIDRRDAAKLLVNWAELSHQPA